MGVSMLPLEMKERRERTTKALTFTCSVEMLDALDALAKEQGHSRAMCARNALIVYLNLTMLGRQEVECKVMRNEACVSLVIKDEEVRARLDKVMEKDKMSVAEVFRRAVWNVTK
jgi:predicted transcriptional regulator